MSHSDVSVCVWTSNFWKTTSCFCCIWLQTSISNPSLLLSFDILFFVNLFLPKKSIHIFRCVVALLLAIKKLEMNREGVSLGFHINTRIFSQMNFFLCVKISLWRIEFRISGTLFFSRMPFSWDYYCKICLLMAIFFHICICKEFEYMWMRWFAGHSNRILVLRICAYLVGQLTHLS